MITGKAAPFAEGLSHFVDGVDPGEIESDRIVQRVLKSVVKGRMDWAVRAGCTGTHRTEHDPEVYENAANRLRGEGVEIEVHRFDEPSTLTVYDGVLSHAVVLDVPHDKVIVRGVNGEPVPREQAPDAAPNHVARIYPPEADAEYSPPLIPRQRGDCE